MWNVFFLTLHHAASNHDSVSLHRLDNSEHCRITFVLTKVENCIMAVLLCWVSWHTLEDKASAQAFPADGVLAAHVVRQLLHSTQ